MIDPEWETIWTVTAVKVDWNIIYKIYNNIYKNKCDKAGGSKQTNEQTNKNNYRERQANYSLEQEERVRPSYGFSNWVDRVRPVQGRIFSDSVKE